MLRIDILGDNWRDAYRHQNAEAMREFARQTKRPRESFAETFASLVWLASQSADRAMDAYNKAVAEINTIDDPLERHRLWRELEEPIVTLRVTDDFAPHSLFWNIELVDHRGVKYQGNILHGGLIYHRDHHDEADVGHWATHT